MTHKKKTQAYKQNGKYGKEHESDLNEKPPVLYSLLILFRLHDPLEIYHPISEAALPYPRKLPVPYTVHYARNHPVL